MLKLSGIKKNYYVADMTVEALKGIDLSFRKNEFVSILGPSGCGKTTLLNIIGGLDKYTSGDLVIAGRSTKEFKDKDWDVYRNHRVGFIFQSYNLIPHQTIVQNVELALTIAGIGKEERTARARKALDRVGLSGMYNKKPNQLSGGQCQRVAIARALVNEPEILLADEPTGALDTETSVQIMELIKEIAKEKLVIMVTHNPELAMKYSSRIVRFLDGKVVEDTDPYESTTVVSEHTDTVSEKAKMSFGTAFNLSLKNLLSKRSRTFLTCFAGSIGIIGISMVLAAQAGVKGYISDMQDDMLSGNPITIQELAFDVNAVTNMMTTVDKLEVIKNANEIGVDYALEKIIDKLSKSQNITKTNEITSDYVNYIKAMPSEYAACVSLDYGIDFTTSIFSDFKPLGQDDEVRSLSTIKDSYAKILSHVEDMGKYSSMIPDLVTAIDVAPNNSDYIKSQYNILSGKIATEKNEIMLVVDGDKNATDLVLAELGYYTQEEYIKIAMDIQKGVNSHRNDPDKFTYDEIMNKEFYWYSNDLIFADANQMKYPGANATYNYNKAKIEAANGGAIVEGENMIPLKVVGILQAKDTISYGCLSSGFYVTDALVQHSLEQNIDSKIVKIINDFVDKYKGTPQEQYVKGLQNTINEMNYNGQSMTVYSGVVYDYEYKYIDADEKIVDTPMTSLSFVSSTDSSSSLMSLIGTAMPGGGASSSSMGSLGAKNVGGSNLPSSISIYPVNFELKDGVTDYLDKWNKDVDITVGDKVIKGADREEVTYTDSVGMIINMVNTLIDIISVALIAFTSLALVVSCVMIAIITYVSVMERIKEIGVIRSLGGRKKDVSHLFNAETFMIGLVSGVIGVGITYLASLIVNVALESMIGVSIFALPVSSAIIMIVISVLLTCISGLIPASSAAKKDPVVALRTE